MVVDHKGICGANAERQYDLSSLKSQRNLALGKYTISIKEMLV